MSSHFKPAFIFIFITLILDVLALGIIIPVLPKLVEEFMGGNTANAAEIYGVFGMAWALMQFLFSPFLGALSDRFGRRPIILISCFGLGLDYLLMAVAPSLWWLFIGRVISGITAASFSTAGAYIADVTPPEKRAASFGMMGAAWGIGFILGPALGGILGDVDPRLPFWVAGSLALLNACYGYFVLPESLAKENRATFSWARANPVGSLKLLRSHPELSSLAIVSFLQHVSHYVLPSTFVLYVGYRYGWDIKTTGATLAMVGVCNVIVQAVLVKRAVQLLGERKMLVVAIVAGFLGYFIYAYAPNGLLFWAGIPIFAFMGFIGPALQGLMTRRVSAQEQGQLQGANSCIMGIAGTFSPVIFTQVFAYFIHESTVVHIPGAPFYLAGVLMMLALFIVWRMPAHEVNVVENK